MMRQKLCGHFTGLIAMLLLSTCVFAQNTNTTVKRVSLPEFKQPVRKLPPFKLQDNNKPQDGKLQERPQLPPKATSPKQPKKKTSYAYGIRPPASNEQEEQKPQVRKGIRPPVPEPMPEQEEKVVKEPKPPSKTRKPSDTTASKKPKVESPKKTKEPDPVEPTEPVVAEPAPAPVPMITSGETGDPKFGFGGGTVANGVETGFLNRAVTVSGVTYRYQVFVPRGWNRRQAWPVILFLHGAGERGDDGLLQTEIGIGTAIRRDVTRFPAVVVLPQCRKGAWWTEAPMQAQAMAALEQSVREFNGDRARLYLTGISMGGFGTWGLAAGNAGMFAAYAPVCGALKLNGRMMVDVKSDDPYTIVARLVAQTPTWIFHGGDDKVVLTEESRKMHEAIKASGGNVQYTEYPGVGHNSWDKAYADPKLMEWLLAQRLKK